MKNHFTAMCGALALAGLTVTAQTPQPSPAQPQTPQPTTITVTGCVTAADESMSAGRAAEAPGREASGTSKSDAASKYMLTSVEHATDTAKAGARGEVEHHTSYALTTEGSTVDLSKHLNHKVELTGTLDQTTRRSPQAASTGTSGSTGTATVGRDASAMRMPAPTLKVTSLKMVSATCR